MDDIAKYTQYLGKFVYVKIDRPKDSKHPKLNFIYEVDYGFIPNTQAGDGHEIDAYVLGQNSPISEFQGICIAVIVRKNDNEHKLVVADQTMRKETIYQQVQFVEQYFDTELITHSQI